MKVPEHPGIQRFRKEDRNTIGTTGIENQTMALLEETKHFFHLFPEFLMRQQAKSFDITVKNVCCLFSRFTPKIIIVRTLTTYLE